MSALGKIEAAPPTVGDAIISAWNDHRVAEAARTNHPDTDRRRECDRLLAREDATTIAAVIAKLRASLWGHATDARIEGVALSAMPLADADALYREVLFRNNYPNECLWTAIRSLERMQDASMTGANRTEWDQAESWYRSLADVEIEGMPEEVRSAVDHALCLTMNHLVEAAPAPDVDALILKMEIARDCSDAGMPSHWWDVLEADVARLVGRAPPASPELDRLIADYFAAGDALNAGAAKAGSLSNDDPLNKAYLAATDALDAYQPVSSDEFVRSLAARFHDDAMPTDKAVFEIVATARRLAGEVAA